MTVQVAPTAVHDIPVLYTYWSARGPGESHISYGVRRRNVAPGMAGLTLSGGVFGIFATFGFNASLVSLLVAGAALSTLLNAPDGGWYEVDDEGCVIAFLGRQQPEHIRGRVGVPLHTFHKQVQILRDV
jgi:hypothetical protein